MSTVIKGSASGQINLNDTTGSIQLNGSDVLTFDSSGNVTVPNNLTVTGSGAGKILQVVQGSSTTQLITTSTSYVDTGLSASITPSSTSSKILVIVSHPTCEKRSDDSGNGISFQLLRGATSISSEPIAYSIGNSATTAFNLMFSVSFNYLDSPSTTSATTYKTQIKNTASGEIKVQRSSAPSTITLMEIAG